MEKYVFVGGTILYMGEVPDAAVAVDGEATVAESPIATHIR